MADTFRQICESEQFKKNYALVLHQTAVVDFPILERQNQSQEIDWRHLLFAASFLSQSVDHNHLDMALRITHGCLIDVAVSKEQRVIAALIYTRLHNEPALKLAIDRKYIAGTYLEDLPLPLSLESIRERYKNTVVTRLGEEHHFNDFQKDFYEAIDTYAFVSASAPTSAGKSYILNVTVRDLLLSQEPKNIIYVVPTRALINQVETHFREIFEDVRSVFISSVPQKMSARSKGTSKLFVLTQERLHWLLLENPDLQFDYIFIDEAQKVSDDTRGILLQQKIEDIQQAQPKCHFIYCSALSENPEELLPKNLNTTTKSLVTRNAVVNQNLIWVSQVPRKPRKLQVNLMQENKSVSLGFVDFDTKPLESIKKSAYEVPSKLSHLNDGGVMIYVSEPSKAEEVAIGLTTKFPELMQEPSQELKDLIEEVKSNIHASYVLKDVLQYGVAFHYGNMPQIIRNEIERLFKTGHIKVLVCTATLLEGVNLPAKTIYITTDKRSRDVPMSDSDFWNLAGRAGRLAQEFQGNIVCINPTNWDVKPTLGNRTYRIQKSLDKMLTEGDDMLAFIKQHIENENIAHSKYEYVFSYYYAAYLRGNGTIKTSGNASAEFLEQMQAVCEEAAKLINIPNDLILLNPGISPLRQQRLVNRLNELINKPEVLFLPRPGEEDAPQEYIRIATRAYKYLDPSYHIKTGTWLSYVAPTAVYWMRGSRLPVMISYNLQSEYNKSQNKKPGAIIRETMQLLEQDIRFTFAKYIACYNDLLNYVFVEHGLPTHQIFDVRAFIEFGVPDVTKVSLISLGFDRNDAVAIAGYIESKDLTDIECEKWLLENDVSAFKLSDDIKAKIRQFKQKFN